MAETKLRVAIRVRPLRSEEGACAWRIEGENVYQADCEEVVGRTAFRYDAVYGENSATKDVYEGVCRELVDGALRGVNGTIFAYGQTSSGKTFTMQGGDKYGAGAPGLMHLAADHIFSVIEARSDTDFLLRVSYLEALILQRAAPRLTGRGRLSAGEVHIREHPGRTGVYVEGAQDVDGAQDAAPRHGRGLSTGREAPGRRRDGHEREIVEVPHGLSHRRRVAAARVRRGPRGIGGGDFFGGSGRVRKSKIDGRDGRAPEGGRQDQPVLLTLSRVVQQLGEKGKENFVNFRDSRLTRLLQPTLSGKAQLAMVCCVAPSCNLCGRNEIHLPVRLAGGARHAEARGPRDLGRRVPAYDAHEAPAGRVAWPNRSSTSATRRRARRKSWLICWRRTRSSRPT